MNATRRNRSPCSSGDASLRRRRGARAPPCHRCDQGDVSGVWVARRTSTDEPFGAPEILPAPVNSAANDFCPTIYLTRHNPEHGWGKPTHLDCAPKGPNTQLDEQGPSLVEIDGVEQLYFSSSNMPAVPGDIFVSEEFGPATEVSELSSPGNDIQPNVRKDGREIVLSSNHGYPGAQGGQDIYAATRASTDDPWSVPVNLGPAINKPATSGWPAPSETRPSSSWDAQTPYFGRAPGPEGMSDTYVSTRWTLMTRSNP